MGLAGRAWSERPSLGAGTPDVQGCPLDDGSGDGLPVCLFSYAGPSAHASPFFHSSGHLSRLFSPLL